MKARAFLLGILLLLPGVSLAESIKAFETLMNVRHDGSFLVTEWITYDFGENNKHGIFRFIPKEHPQDATSWYKDRYLNLGVRSVKLDGNSVPYEEFDSDKQLFLKIGDPISTQTGQHVYEITYGVWGGLSHFDDGKAELYWNVTGDEWDVPIEFARTVLIGDVGVYFDERACYIGGEGSGKSCESLSDTGEYIEFIGGSLAPREGFTVANEIDRTQVEEVILEENKTVLLGLLGFLVLLIVIGVLLYRYKTEHRTGRTIIPQYEPYQNLMPMYSGVLFDGTLHPEDITACIVYLASEGLLKITRTEKKVLFLFEVEDYEIKLLRPIAYIESEFQRDVVKLLFGSLPEERDAVTLSSLKNSTSRQTENQKVLKELKKDLEKDMKQNGFYEVKIGVTYRNVLIGVLTGAVFVLFQSFVMGASQAVLVVLSAAAVGAALALIFNKRRTRKGYEVLDHLKGFKEFLSVTDKERYEFHNAPEKNPEQFLQYLPYAIAFGVEEKWAEVFKDITIPNPEWYDGGSAHVAFSSTDLSTSLGAFSTAFASSSGSSGTSGSSGGGFSGGGGGGGGGGSW